MTTPSSAKRAAVEALLSGGRSVMLFLDPRRSFVSVPYRFRKDWQLILEIGYNMANPIHDLLIDDLGVSCTLSFSGRPHTCMVPWAALFGAKSAVGMIMWPADAPRELSGGTTVDDPTPAPVARGAAVIDLDSRRTPRDRMAVAARRAAPSSHDGTDGAA